MSPWGSVGEGSAQGAGLKAVVQRRLREGFYVFCFEVGLEGTAEADSSDFFFFLIINKL